MIESGITVAQFLDELGTVFESFLSQDSGNRSYSLNTLEGPKWAKVLNLIRTPLDDVEALIRFYNGLKSRLIPKNWDLVKLFDGLILVHDWVPGRVLHSPGEDSLDINSAYQYFIRLPLERRLAVFEEILDLFQEIEQSGIIVEDFYDGCIIYDFDNHTCHICDLDHIHDGPYQLARSRQFGSTRFMAPEEFKMGSRIDRRTNVYTMGATGYVLLNDNNREPENWPLSRRLYEVLAKATSHSKDDRQQSVAEFHRHWKAAIGQKQR